MIWNNLKSIKVLIMNKQCVLNFILMALFFCCMFGLTAIFVDILEDWTIAMNSHASKSFLSWVQYIGVGASFSLFWAFIWVMFKVSEKNLMDCIYKK